MADLLDAVRSEIEAIFPIKGRQYTLRLAGLSIPTPPPSDIATEERAKNGQNDLAVPVKLQLEMIDNSTGEVVSKGTSTLLRLPYKTMRDTYLVGGKERVVLNQLRMRPGTYVRAKPDGDVQANMRLPGHGSFKITRTAAGNWQSNLRLRGHREGLDVPAAAALTVAGVHPDQVVAATGEHPSADQVRKAAASLHRYLTGSPAPSDLDEARRGVREALGKLTFGPDGTAVNRSTMGAAHEAVTPELLTQVARRVSRVSAGKEPGDDPNELRYQRVMSPDDLVREWVHQGLQNFVDKVRPVLDNRTTTRTRMSQIVPFGAAEQTLWEQLKGQLSEHAEETNPLNLLSTRRRITATGPGALESRRQATEETRNVHVGAFGRIDPVETQESSKIGLVGHLALGGEVKNGTIVSRFYPVHDGKVQTGAVELTPEQDYDAVIAFNDPRYVHRGRDGTIALDRHVLARHKERTFEADRSQVQYLDETPNGFLDYPGNLIPFAAHNDGNRMLMASNMQRQAVPLSEREAPIVDTLTEPGGQRTFTQEVADLASHVVRARADGVVKSVAPNLIVVTEADGKDESYPLYHYHPLNHEHAMSNEAVVKPGDHVKKGDMLAEGWFTKGGKLALGLNARVAYMPFKGYNFEDGIVVSKSFADRMASDEVRVLSIPIGDDELGGPGSGLKAQLRAMKVLSPAAIRNLDEDGIIKAGSEVEPGDVLVGRLRPREGVEVDPVIQGMIATGALPANEYADDSYVIRGFIRGNVLRVHVASGADAGEGGAKAVVQVTVAVKSALKEGDKIVGRHGNKGTVTHIEDDDKMPQTEDGKPVEVLYSPLAIPSRKNMGQLLELNAGLVASKTGKPFYLSNFDPTAAERVKAGLREIGTPSGKVTLINPDTGRPYENPVSVGTSYLMKLVHQVDQKLQGRSSHEEHALYRAPLKRTGDPEGEKRNPQSIGEMEMRALQAHGAVQNLLESSTLKSDGVADRLELYRALVHGGNLPAPTVPEATKVLADNLRALGMNVTPLHNGRPTNLDGKFEQLALLPSKQRDIMRWSRGEVNNPHWMASMVRGQVGESGGLFDPKIFGDSPKEQRTFWGHINLPEPVPNPIFAASQSLNPYALLTGFTAKQIGRLMDGELVLVTNPGDTGWGKDTLHALSDVLDQQRAGKKLEYQKRGEAIHDLLDRIDVKEELAKTKAQLKAARNPDARDVLYKRFRVLQTLKDDGLSPTDLMLHAIPVMPVAMRPMLLTPGTQRAMPDSANVLYRNVIYKAGDMDFLKNQPGNPPEEEARQGKDYWNSVQKLFGTVYPGKYHGQDLKSLLARLRSKGGIPRGRLLRKRVDYSGRSVISVDPTLKIDEIGLPAEIARRIYEPLVIHRLVQTGRAKSVSQARDMLKDRQNELVEQSLHEVAAERPVIANRQPSLHKFSALAFHPKITQGHTIALHPLVTTGFNADFDGDTMAVHVPLTPEAVQEAKSLLLPSQNLINPTNGEVVPMLKHEMLLGIFYLTKKGQITGKPQDFSSLDQLRQAWRKGDIGSFAPVRLGGIVATVGQQLVNGVLPKRLRDYNRQLAKNNLQDLIKDINDHEGPARAVTVLDDLKDLGFEAATISGMSIGTDDFVPAPKDVRENIFSKAQKKIDEDPAAAPAALAGLDDDIRAQIDGPIQDELARMDSPVYAMVQSGARGKLDQVRQMSGAVGVGYDITGHVVPFPVKHSFLEGLGPAEFWAHAHDARRGMAARALWTAKPGYLSRLLWHATQNAVIVERDCDDHQGVDVNHTENGSVTPGWSGLIGRVLNRDVHDDRGRLIAGAMRGEMITPQMRAAFEKANIGSVSVRSPITCKAAVDTNHPGDLCAVCYGAMPGTMRLPGVGTPVGVLASQAFGEPLAQGTMNAFHVSGSSSTAVAQSYPRLEEVLNLNEPKLNPAPTAPRGGVVEKIEQGPDGTVVTVRGRPIAIPSNQKLLPGIVVGAALRPGEPLTDGDLDPREVARLHGIPAAQNYIADQLSKQLGPLSVDRKHIELVTAALTRHVKVKDGGNSGSVPGEPGWMPGQIADRNAIDHWNATEAKLQRRLPTDENLVGSRSAQDVIHRGQVLARAGQVIDEDAQKALAQVKSHVFAYPRPVSYEPHFAGKTVAPKITPNWLGRIGFGDVRDALTTAAIQHQIDQLDEPRSRYMTGKLMNVGKGFQQWFQGQERMASQAGQSIAGWFGGQD